MGLARLYNKQAARKGLIASNSIFSSGLLKQVQTYGVNYRDPERHGCWSCVGHVIHLLGAHAPWCTHPRATSPARLDP